MKKNKISNRVQDLCNTTKDSYSECRKNSWESRKRADNPLGTWVRFALHRDVQMANNHWKRCSTTLVEEMQIRTESNTTTHPLECLKCTRHS